jgi:hypothetical protein
VEKFIAVVAMEVRAANFGEAEEVVRSIVQGGSKTDHFTVDVIHRAGRMIGIPSE